MYIPEFIVGGILGFIVGVVATIAIALCAAQKGDDDNG